MLRIDSNLSGVLRQTERLVARIPVAMESALDKRHWEAEARDVALKSIYASGVSVNEMAHVNRVVDTLLASFFKGAMSLKMHSPYPPRPTLQTAQAAGAVLDPTQGFSSLFLAPVQSMEDMILRWVQAPEGQGPEIEGHVRGGGKRRDARDFGKTDEEIAHIISYIMLSPMESLGPKGQLARIALTPHIEAFLIQQTAGPGGVHGPDETTIDKWLRAVLAAWRFMVKFKYAGLVRDELNAMKGEL